MDDKIKIIEKKRKAALIPTVIFLALIIVTVAAFVFTVLFGASFVFPTLSVILTIVAMGISVYFSKQYIDFYKQNFVSAALDSIFDNVYYQPRKCISKDVIRNAHMVRVGNTFKGDDYISAEYKGIKFVYSDLTVQQVNNNGKTTTTTTYFRGKWMIFDFNKDFDEYVIIAEKKGGANIDGKVNNRIKLESADFNDRFRTYATDDHTAFYLITPQFITSLDTLSKQTKGQLILGFVNGKLHIALHTNKNSMEPNVFRPVSENAINDIRDEMKLVTDFLEALAVDKPDFKTDIKDTDRDPFGL